MKLDDPRVKQGLIVAVVGIAFAAAFFNLQSNAKANAAEPMAGVEPGDVVVRYSKNANANGAAAIEAAKNGRRRPVADSGQ